MISISSAPPAQPAWRGLLRPMLLISIALHGLLFFMPTPSAPEAPREETEEKVTLTQLPSATTPSPAATPAVRPTPARPTPAAAPTPVQRIPPRANPVPPVRSSIARPATPRPQPTQAAPASQPNTAATQPTQAAASTSAPPATDPFVQGFPSYPNAQQGSFEGLPPEFATSGFKTDDPLATVASFFETQLASAGYSANEVSSDGRQRIYEVSRNGETQYLTLLANPNGSGTTYVLSRERSENIAEANLQDPAQSELFADLGSAIFATGIEWQDVDPVFDPVNTLLSSPASFFTAAGTPEAGRRAGVLQAQISNGDSQAVLDALSSVLEQQYGVAIAPDQEYGGGFTYQVSREASGRGSPVTAYLVLVPTSDNRTMLALWDRRPS